MAVGKSDQDGGIARLWIGICEGLVGLERLCASQKQAGRGHYRHARTNREHRFDGRQRRDRRKRAVEQSIRSARERGKAEADPIEVGL
jgi:hypothetical protein